MASTRRSFLGLAGAAVGSFALARLPLGGDSDEAWFQKELAQTRSASASELSSLRNSLFDAARAQGYPDDLLTSGAAIATMSVNPMGNSVGKIALALDETSVVWMVKEFRATGDREVVSATWVHGDSAGGILPSEQSAALSDPQTRSTYVVQAAAQDCCSHLGTPGTCCRYNFQGLFECCGPCAFSIPSPPAFVACAIVWCNYCATAHCSRFYTVC